MFIDLILDCYVDQRLSGGSFTGTAQQDTADTNQYGC
jgi:hypothetical protein